MSLLDLLDVPEAKSRASTSPTFKPRVAASSADPVPTTPPPTTSTSSSVEAIASSAASGACGESPTDRMICSLLRRYTVENEVVVINKACRSQQLRSRRGESVDVHP